MTTPLNRPEDVVQRGIRSSLIGAVINLLLAAAKCFAGIAGHSFALVADGIESLGDVVSSSVVAFGLWFSIRPPDEDHPYGHGKAEPIAAIAVSLALAAAGVLIAAESISEIRTPHQLPAAYTLGVLICVVLLKLLLSRYVRSVGTAIESTAVKADAWHHLSDAITSGLAFIGISIGLITQNPAADDWAALAASPIIIFNGLRLLRAPVAELLDAAPPKEVELQVRQIAGSVAGVVDLEKCFVRKTGFRYYVDLHVLVAEHLTVRESHSLGHAVEAEVLNHMPQVSRVLVHIEPA